MTEPQRRKRVQQQEAQQVPVSLSKAEEAKMPLVSADQLARNIKTRGQLEQEEREAQEHARRQFEHEQKRKESEQFVTAIKWTLVAGAVVGLGYMAYFYSPKIFKHAATGVEIIVPK